MTIQLFINTPLKNEYFSPCLSKLINKGGINLNFAERWRNLRIDKLNLTSKQAAYMLGISPAAYSNYELGKRPFPSHIILSLQTTFNLTDAQLLSLFKTTSQKRQNLSEQQIQYELQAIRNRYLTSFGEDVFEFFVNYPELITYIALLKNFEASPTEIKKLLNEAIQLAEQSINNK